MLIRIIFGFPDIPDILDSDAAWWSTLQDDASWSVEFRASDDHEYDGKRMITHEDSFITMGQYDHN